MDGDGSSTARMTEFLEAASWDAVATPYVICEEYDEETLETTIEIGWEWNVCPDCGKVGAHPTNSGRGGVRCG